MATEHSFAVAGAKGGVGKTTNSLNIASALAERGRETIVVEADLAMANAVDFLDIDVDPESDPTLHGVLAGNAAVEDAIYGTPDGVDLLPSGVTLEGFATAEPERLESVLDALRSKYDGIVVDTSAGLNRETLYPMGLADQTIVTSTPRVASVRDVEKTIELARRAGGDVRGIVFTKSGTGTAPAVERIAEFLDVDLLGHVPEDEAVPAAQDAGRTVIEYAPESGAAEAYRTIAATLERDLASSWSPPKPPADTPRGGDASASGIVPTDDSSGHPRDEDAQDAVTSSPATDGGDPAAESTMASPDDGRVDRSAVSEDARPERSAKSNEQGSGDRGGSSDSTDDTAREADGTRDADRDRGDETNGFESRIRTIRARVLAAIGATGSH